MDAKVDEITEALARIEENQGRHIADYHGDLTPQQALDRLSIIEYHHTELLRQRPLIDMVIEEVVGKEIHDPVTNIAIGREPSIREIVEKMEHRSNGGKGVSVSFASLVKYGVVSAAITALSLIIVTFMGGL